MSGKPVQKMLMGLLAALMIGGMAYQFMPALQGGGVGGMTQTHRTPAIKVNGETVSVQDLDAIRTSNPVLSSVEGGVLADDFRLYVVSQRVLQTLYAQGAKDIKISREDVAAEVQKIRDSQHITSNKEWTDFLQRQGLSDSQARSLIREQLAVRKKVEEIENQVPAPTDQELQTYYTINKNNYKTDPQIVGRQIVVADEKVAQSLLTQARGGTSFAELASQNSLENKERGGALGPLENGVPKAVATVVLPNEVAQAALGLPHGGITDVIKSGGRFYIVKVDKVVEPRIKTFDEAKSSIQTEVKKLKQEAAVENWVDGLVANAQIEYIEPSWKVEDPIIATVGTQNIKYSEVINQVVSNHQVLSMLNQMPPEQIDNMLNTAIKPNIVTQLINQYAAPTISKNLNLNLVGTRQQQLQQLGLYAGKDILISDGEIQSSYNENISAFKIPGTATISEAVFKTKAAASAFITDWNGNDFTGAATKAGAIVSERGKITEGDGKIRNLEGAIFKSGLRSKGNGYISEPINIADQYHVAYVEDLKLSTSRPLSEVSSQIKENLLQTKQAAESESFIQKQVALTKPVNHLQKVVEEQAKRIAAAEAQSKKEEEVKESESKSTDSNDKKESSNSSEKSTTEEPMKTEENHEMSSESDHKHAQEDSKDSQ